MLEGKNIQKTSQRTLQKNSTYEYFISKGILTNIPISMLVQSFTSYKVQCSDPDECSAPLSSHHRLNDDPIRAGARAGSQSKY